MYCTEEKAFALIMFFFVFVEKLSKGDFDPNFVFPRPHTNDKRKAKEIAAGTILRSNQPQMTRLCVSVTRMKDSTYSLQQWQRTPPWFCRSAAAR